MTPATASPSAFASAGEHAAAVRDGRVSSEELTTLYLERIRRHDPTLCAIVVGNEIDALATARERDEELRRGELRGPLHGVPVTVKEAFDVAGLRTTVNAPQLRNNFARSDAFVVRRLREAGACILGKTNNPLMLSDYQSFGPIYPTASNPWDVTRTPGGSTGGGGAAVAAGLTALEIGSDIGGSIRVPAHFCGVFGLKPTENHMMHGEGHVPPLPGGRGGFIAMASIGPLARTMADVEMAWTLINQPTWTYFLHCPSAPRRKAALQDYRVAWFDDVGRIPCGDETRQVLAGFLRTLEAAGVEVERRPFDDMWIAEAHELFAQLFGFILGQDTPWVVRQLMKVQFGRMAKGSVMRVLPPLKRGLSLDFVDFTRALRRRQVLIQEMHRRFDEYDFIVSPVAAGPAFPHNPRHRPIQVEGHTYTYLDHTMPFTSIYNSCGNPVLVVPAGRGAGGLPIGLQIAAPHYAEQELIHFGKLVEQLGVTFVPPDGYDGP